MSVNYSGNNTNDPAARRATRDNLVRNYNSESASRARSARLRAQESTRAYKDSAARAHERAARIAEAEAVRKEEEARAAAHRAHQRDLDQSRAREDAEAETSRKRRGTVTTRSPRSGYTPRPLTTAEYQQRTRQQHDQYEAERNARDAYSERRLRTGSNRTVIDARGTIDSRAFNERELITNRTIDDRDRHYPETSTTEGGQRWRTRSGSEAEGGAGITGQGNLFNDKFSQLGQLYSGLPPFVKIAIPVIIILIIILIVLLVRG